MRILLTGGTGFVGRWLSKDLVRAGHRVRLALRDARPGLGFESVVVGDIGPSTAWGAALQGMDAVVHLAARVHVMRDHADGADEFDRINTGGTLRLARCAAEAGVRRFIFLSTIKVNGESTAPGRPFHPDDEPACVDAYGRSKRDAECGLRQMPGLDPVIVRPPLIHGPGAKGNLARLCRLAQIGCPVPFAGIRNSRDLLGLVNLSNLIERCLWHAAAPGNVFLASDGQPLSTARLFEIIAGEMGRPARMLDVPPGVLRAVATPLGLGPEMDRLTQSLEVDISRTRTLLGWAPPEPVESGIATMARAFLARSR
jgi:nucleoside-diphosphate-sugar epimerase